MSIKPVIDADALSCGPYDQAFFEASGDWLSNPELRQLIRAEESHPDDRARWFASLPSREDYWIWGISLSGRPIGCFGIKQVDRVNRCGEYWGYIGDPHLWGRKIGPWILRQAMNRAAESGLESLYLHVWQHNERAVRLYKRAGFRVIGQAEDILTMSTAVFGGSRKI